MIKNFVKPHEIYPFYLEKQKRSYVLKKVRHVSNRDFKMQNFCSRLYLKLQLIFYDFRRFRDFSKKYHTAILRAELKIAKKSAADCYKVANLFAL